jgi:uncharacterized protein (UPF0264 family)
MPQRLLVSVRGPTEALAAAQGGAHIADVEYPASLLGTAGFQDMPMSTNIGEDQPRRGTACQAALGVAIAGADYVKCGFAGLDPKAAKYLGSSLVRTIREWCPNKKVYPAVFPDEEFLISFDPLKDGPRLVEAIDCDGLLIDTFNKTIGKGLLDYYAVDEISTLVRDLHSLGKEAWIAGSISKSELRELWGTGVDVICVRGAACEPIANGQRLGEVTAEIVAVLVSTMATK